MAGLVSLIFFTTQSTHALTANAADALFFTRFGVRSLPVMYMLLGLVAMASLLVYAAGLSGLRRRYFYPLGLSLLATTMALLRLSLLLEARWVYAVTWIVGSLEILVTYALIWNVAGDVADARSGKRLFPVFASAGILGGVVGNLATGPVAGFIGVENILLVVAALLLVVAALTVRNAMRYGRVHEAPTQAPGAFQELRIGYRLAMERPLLRLLGAAMILASVLYYAVAFPFSVEVAEAFSTETEIASFLGLFSAAATFMTLVVSLFVAGWLFRRIGIIGALLVVAFIYVAGFSLWLISFGLLAASLVRFAQWVAIKGIGGTARAAVFNTVRSDHRGSVMAFMVAVPLQLGITVGGVILWFLERRMTTYQLFVIGLVAAVMYTGILWAMQRHYLQALVSALHRGVADVFLSVDQAVPATRANAETVAAIRHALASTKAELRRAALEVAAQVGATALIKDARRALDDDDIGVRVAAIEALLALREPFDADVTGVLGPVGESGGALPTAPPSIRRRAAVVLDRIGEDQVAESTLVDMTKSPLPAVRAAGLLGVAEIGRTPTNCDVRRLLSEDSSPAVRAAAARAVAADPGGGHGPVIAAMNDLSPQVRRAAAEAWHSSVRSSGPLLNVLRHGTPRAQEAALIALTPADHAAVKQIDSLVQPALAAAVSDSRRSSAIAAGAALTSGAAAWLAKLLDERSWSRQRVVIRAIGVEGDRETTELILGGLQSRDVDARAQALEALDRGRDELTTGILELAESDSAPSLAAEEALLQLVRDEDEWIRALAVSTIGDQSGSRWESTIRDKAEDTSAIVRATARLLADESSAHMSEVFDVVGPVERVLALRRVPIFSSLPPEDLHRIATAAVERSYGAGSVVFTAGEPGTEMAVILEGTLISTIRKDGGVEIFAEYGQGEQVGELSLLREGPRASDVVASTDARVLSISKDVVEALLAERPDVARAILASIADRLAAVTLPGTLEGADS